jgi:hypothetical protein
MVDDGNAAALVVALADLAAGLIILWFATA